MNFKIIPTPLFEKELKRLSKKYISVKTDISKEIVALTNDPTRGISLGNDCFKIRVAITSKNKGKSGGARLITYVKVVNEVIYLISIYDKSESETITDKELSERLKGL